METLELDFNKLQTLLLENMESQAKFNAVVTETLKDFKARIERLEKEDE